MYYVLNQTHQLIAADEALLSLCGVTHIDDLSSKLIKNEINFQISDDADITIILEDTEKQFTVKKTALSSLLGDIVLVEVLAEEDTQKIPSATQDDEETVRLDSMMHEESNEDVSISDEDDIKTEEAPLLSDTSADFTFGDDVAIDDDIMTLKDEDVNKDIATQSPVDVEEDNDTEFFDILSDETQKSTTEESVDEGFTISEDTEDTFDISAEVSSDEILEINIDVPKLSQEIGISTEDYREFLDEFIDTALELEDDLQSSNDSQRQEATHTLSQLSDVLQIPTIGEILNKIETANAGEARKHVESFYASLSQITTIEESDTTAPTEELSKEIAEDEPLELFDAPEPIKDPEIALISEKKVSPEGGFGTISLEGIKPKHFDFQLEEAANDLSLPVELIEEFVHDFIDQAQEETQNMLKAYEAGDLDAIQKIGHLLKGASSNLRINALSDTLYKIQFCEDSNNLEMLIKDYWAHFLSFKNQINTISN